MSKYVEEVLGYIYVDRKTRKRIKEDLQNRIDEASDDDPYFDPYQVMGSPEEVANEFVENLDTMYPGNIVQVGSSIRYEYKSEKMLFGLPLIHINMGGRLQNKRAKGIVAIGDIATGVVSIGGVAVGAISIGGIGIGIIGLGGVVIAGIAVGGVAVGAVAVGGVAIGLLNSFGGLALVKSFFTWMIK